VAVVKTPTIISNNPVYILIFYVADFTIPPHNTSTALFTRVSQFASVIAVMDHPKYPPSFYVTVNCVTVARSD